MEVLLFYKYTRIQDVIRLKELHENVLRECNLYGRVLIAEEGINGSLCGAVKDCTKYKVFLESYKESISDSFLFEGIDWKNSPAPRQAFPDRTVRIVSEIVQLAHKDAKENGVDFLECYGGKHLSPREWQEKLDDYAKNRNDGSLVVIDCRNSFEASIGRFRVGDSFAEDPGLKSTSEFPKWVAENKERLKDKEVLMYCTGGIRCEKAGALLRHEGVENVSQLEGGIHRYLETFPSQRSWVGKNFVFDQRGYQPLRKNTDQTQMNTVFGQCISCSNEFDEIHPFYICTVCRDMVLVCYQCRLVAKQDKWRSEFYCSNHMYLQGWYFSFLEGFSVSELQAMKSKLSDTHGKLDTVFPGRNNVKRRRTIRKQIQKISERMSALSLVGNKGNDRSARCRTCSSRGCDGYCWGTWKRPDELNRVAEVSGDELMGKSVQRGADWRWGNQDIDEHRNQMIGKIIETKHFSVAGETSTDFNRISDYPDAVRVEWENGSKNLYRYGFKGCFDVQIVENTANQ